MSRHSLNSLSDRDLTPSEAEMVATFLSVTETDDADFAAGFLFGFKWRVEDAIEAWISQEAAGDDDDDDDDDDIGADGADGQEGGSKDVEIISQGDRGLDAAGDPLDAADDSQFARLVDDEDDGPQHEDPAQPLVDAPVAVPAAGSAMESVPSGISSAPAADAAKRSSKLPSTALISAQQQDDRRRSRIDRDDRSKSGSTVSLLLPSSGSKSSSSGSAPSQPSKSSKTLSSSRRVGSTHTGRDKLKSSARTAVVDKDAMRRRRAQMWRLRKTLVRQNWKRGLIFFIAMVIFAIAGLYFAGVHWVDGAYCPNMRESLLGNSLSYLFLWCPLHLYHVTITQVQGLKWRGSEYSLCLYGSIALLVTWSMWAMQSLIWYFESRASLVCSETLQVASVVSASLNFGLVIFFSISTWMVYSNSRDVEQIAQERHHKRKLLRRWLKQNAGSSDAIPLPVDSPHLKGGMQEAYREVMRTS